MKSIFTCRRLPNWRFAFPARLSSLIKAFSILFFVSILFYSSKTFSQIALVSPPTGGFHIDGNLRANTPTANIGDWLTGAGGTGGFVMSDAGAAVNAATTQLLPKDLYNTTADLMFTSGSKFDGNPNTAWTWTASKPTGKDDINNAMYHVTTDGAGNRWLMLGSDRLSTTGTSYIDFEFLQKTLTRNPSGGGFTSGGTSGGRTINDIVLSMEYTGGGSTAKVHFYKWQVVGSGFDWVEYKFTPDGGPIPTTSAFGMTNAASTPVPFLAFGLTSYIPFSFVEAAINLTALFGSIDPCLGLNVKTIFIKTKASDAISAALKDFVDPIQVTLNFNAPTIDARGPFCVDASPITLTGSPSGGTFSGTGVSGTTFSPSVAGVGTHTITYTYTQNGCNKTATTDIVVTAKPSAPSATPTQPTCTVATGSITITGVTGETYSFDGGAYSATLTYGSLAAGSSHTIVAKNAAGCTSPTTTITLNAQPGSPSAPGATPTQPTCTVATGSITITGVSGETYSFDGGAFSATLTYGSLAAGSSHTIVAKNAAGCTSPTTTITLNAQPASPSAPGATPTQPTCTVATGSITITGVSGETYSFDGGAFSSTLTYGSLAAGSSHTIVAKNAATCTSPTTTITLNTQPASPSAPSATPTQPTCTVATGSITITGVSGETYSFDGGAFSSTLTYGSLAAGSSHTIVAKNAAGCTSPTTTITLGNAPANPTFTVCLVQPTLCANSGSVTINASGGSGFTYSIDGSNFSNTTGVFNNLGSGSVTSIQVKNSEGCSSSPINCVDAVSNCSAPLAFNSSPVQITDGKTTVKAYPNPFNDQVKFVVNSAQAGSGTLDLYNMMGQKVKTVFHGFVPAGVNNFDLNLPGQKNSTLIYRFSMGTKQITGKLLQINR